MQVHVFIVKEENFDNARYFDFNFHLNNQFIRSAILHRTSQMVEYYNSEDLRM